MSSYSDKEKYIIESFQQDELMMAHVFSQWCVNNGLDPVQVYKEAYGTADSSVLNQAVELTVSKEEAGDISTSTLLNVLSLYNNDALAERVVYYDNQKGSK
ncbi:hypothetical protein [Alkalicoccus luteus]|uniref:Uncharacterized protein n=1 Tax=Alkalicoccus luteus TaxID=1237094 RepID=A0A969PVK3_9BACI|nr:hypothetical protein [Alkalicoccus luteus]NJP39166.1 hypothetical protein [Alkalicoccus luteus]